MGDDSKKYVYNEIRRKYGGLLNMKVILFGWRDRKEKKWVSKWRRNKQGKADTIWYWLQINVHLLIIISKLKHEANWDRRFDTIHKISSYIRIKFSQCYPKPIPIINFCRIHFHIHDTYINMGLRKKHFIVCVWCTQICISIELTFHATSSPPPPTI